MKSREYEEPTAHEQVERARCAWEEREQEKPGAQLKMPLEQGESKNLQLTLDTGETSC